MRKLRMTTQNIQVMKLSGVVQIVVQNGKQVYAFVHLATGNVLNAMVVRHSRNDIQNLKSFIQRTMISHLKTESCLIILTDSGNANMDMNSKILLTIFTKEDFDVHIVKVSRCFRDSTILLH